MWSEIKAQKKQTMVGVNKARPNFCTLFSLKDSINFVDKYEPDVVDKIYTKLFNSLAEADFLKDGAVEKWDDSTILAYYNMPMPPSGLEAILKKIELDIASDLSIPEFLVFFQAAIGVKGTKSSAATINAASTAMVQIRETETEKVTYKLPSSISQNDMFIKFKESFGRSEFATVGQVICNSDDYEPFAIELLLRYTGETTPHWANPENIIKDATQCEALFLITEFMFEEAARWISELKEHQYSIPVTVNLSPFQMSCPDAFPTLSEVMAEHDIKNKDIIIELTEEHETFNNVNAMYFIDQCSKKGFTLALDDLGMGYSNIDKLATGYFKIVKLDKCVALNVSRLHFYRRFVFKLAELTEELGGVLIIEGVENTGDEFPQGRNIKYQGFGIAKPKCSADVLQYLSDKYHNELIKDAKSN